VKGVTRGARLLLTSDGNGLDFYQAVSAPFTMHSITTFYTKLLP
jgi:hypothetical protein